MNPTYDVLIIGAGLSGIGTACHLALDCPQKRVAIIERRDAIGGTWDLFRYPGIRSDSDMCTFGFQFRPWNELSVLADGASIRRYVTETAQQYGVDKKIQFGLKTLSAHWSSEQQLWTVTALHEASGATRTMQAKFLVGATGYYNYDQGHLPHFPGVERFKGQCIHPQQWPEDLDFSGKRVVIIGSGATAVTLVPAMADDAASVTMLQRSPSYVFSLPGYDKLSEILLRFLPRRWVFGMARQRNIKFHRLTYLAAKRWPSIARRLLLLQARRQLGPGADMSHFTPHYNPWDQRLCAVPDSDLFKAIRSGKATVVTDHIERFTETGIELKSGRVLEADIVVTATGLQLQMLGGMELRVDGQPRPPNQLMMYKGVLMQDVPNMAWIVGYTNISWTLKADLSGHYFCRLLRFMDDNNLTVAMPAAPQGMVSEGTVFGSLSSGYVQRAADVLPRQGTAHPWLVTHHYENDSRMLRDEPVDDGVLQFAGARDPSVARSPIEAMAA